MYTNTASPMASGPVHSTAPAAARVNSSNLNQATAQAIADAKKAADYMNATAPGSPAAQQANRAYLETRRLASRANATHDPTVARQAVQASQASVNYINNVATGRSPNTSSPYDSNGNVYSYYNSSFETGKIPSTDAPRIKEISEEQAYYCSTTDSKGTGTIVVVNDDQTMMEYNIYMGAAIVMDLGQIVASFIGAAASAAIVPSSAGTSAILGFAFLESLSVSAVQFSNDIATIIKANSDYHSGKSFKLEITQNAVDFLIFGIFSTEEVK